jgi:Uma2 family endonuclease
VAAVSQERWDAIDADDNLHGAPELVIEVRPPSNSKAQRRELVALCLANGAIECWIVDPQKKSVTVIRGDGFPVVCLEGEDIALAAFGSDRLPVAEIFATAIGR